MRKPITQSGINRSQSQSVSTMAIKGLNNEDLPQLLDLKFAQTIKNYLIEGQGKLVKRKGFTEFKDFSASVEPVFLARFTSDIYLIAHGTTLKAYTISTDTITSIKTDFTNSRYEGEVYADYFYICNGNDGDDIGYVDVATLSWNTIAGAPKAEVLFQIDGRLFAGNTDTDVSEVHYAEKDDGSNPPFSNWTVPATILPTSPNKIINRNLGAVKNINTLSNSIIVFYENGAYAFSIGQIAAGSTIVQETPTVFQSKDFGGERKSVVTEAGIFYANERGIWRMYGVASTLKGNSKSEVRISKILGDDYFDDVTLTDLDIIYDQKRNSVLFTLGKDSDTNNIVLVYNINAESWTTISGWPINRFMADGANIYGIDTRAVKIYKLFDGQNDNGSPINTEYTQEINLGDITTRKSLENFFIQAEMSPLSSLVVHFDRYNRRGVLEKDVITARTFEAILTGSDYSGVGSSPYGSSGWGSLGGVAEKTNTLGQYKSRVNDLYRLIIRITSNDDSDHTLNWFSVITKNKNINLRLNNLT